MTSSAQSIAEVLGRAVERDDAHDSGELPKSIAGLPVEGYRDQSAVIVALVNANKRIEEQVLRVLDALAMDPETDKRWLAIGRTGIEQGFMAVSRAIFKPVWVELAEPRQVESGWVLERADSPASAPLYYSPDGSIDPWSFDHQLALRFARREDAEAFSTTRSTDIDVRICEHQWG